MAAWSSPSSSHRARSPSPHHLLTPRALPSWLRANRPTSTMPKGNRFRIILTALLCIICGWLLTSALGPGRRNGNLELSSFRIASTGILEDPGGTLVHAEAGTSSGILAEGGVEGEHTWSHKQKAPSVSGALSDLHQAVSSKIKSWNPYFVPSSLQHHPKGNETTNQSDAKKSSLPLSGEFIKDGIGEAERLGARVRIGKCTVLFRGNGFWERCIRTHERHDRQHGYRLHVLREELMDDVWSKPAYILSLLLRELSKPASERLDWLFWVDSDTIILNPYIPIETFLPPPGTEFDDVYMMYSQDWNGLNNGVFPLRVNQWAVNLFSAIVAYRKFKPDEPLQFRDQSAMTNMIREPEFARHIVQAPQRWFNAYQGEHNETLQPFQVRRGDLLVHFAGVVPREERMQFWLERAEQHLEEWEMPVKSTSYPEEAREFWREQKGLRRDKAEALRQVKDEANKLLALTEQRLADFGDRLSSDQKANIVQCRDALRKTMDQESTRDDRDKIAESIKQLSESASSLISVIGDANKILLQTVHDSVFAAERVLLDGGFGNGKASPELDAVFQAVKRLKAIIVTPEETWNRPEIIASMDALSEARGKQQDKMSAELAAQQKANEEELAQQQTASTVEASLEATVSSTTTLQQDAAPTGG